MVDTASLQYQAKTTIDWYSSLERRDGALVTHALPDATNLQ